jgi:hypothetical protein
MKYLAWSPNFKGVGIWEVLSEFCKA